jgi:hypothetical protein
MERTRICSESPSTPVDALLDSDRKMRDAGHRGGSESIYLGE